MRGNILEYSKLEDKGTISGQDGKRYSFVRANIRTGSLPLKNALVDFEPSEGTATDIVYIITKGKSSVSRGTYIILGIFFGLLGIHNFYAGRNMIGFIQLFCAVFIGWLTGFILSFGVAVWVLVELFTVTHDGSGRQMS